jgi:hypothetical protein
MQTVTSEVESQPIHVKGFYPTFGAHRGMRVATITVRASDLSPSGAVLPAWPPDGIICEAICNALIYVLKRDWVGYIAMPDTLPVTIAF